MERFDITMSATPGELNTRSTRRVHMANEPYEISFGGILKAACDGSHEARRRLRPDVFSENNGLAMFRLPVVGEEHAIPATAIQDTPSYGVISWIQSSGVPLLDQIRTIPVATRRGILPIGGQLPEARMVAEDPMAATAAQSDPGLTGVPFELSRTVEVQTRLTSQLITQSSEGILDAIEDALQRSIAERLLQQILAGDGQNNQLVGLPSRTDVDGGTYVQHDRGDADGFMLGETAVEDADGTPSAWIFGSSLSDAARATVVEPGASIRVEQEGRLSLSGIATYRDGSLVATTGICADWAKAVTLVTALEIEFVVNRISKPGEVWLTARLPVDLLVIRPEQVFVLTEV